MKLINPENSYSNNLAGKVGPVINETHLSDTTVNWLVEVISSIYDDDLDQALLLAQYIKILGGKEEIPEDYTIFRLLLTIKGYINAPNLPIKSNHELEEEIKSFLSSNYSPDYHSFMHSFIQEREDRLYSGGMALYIHTHEIAVFLLKEKLIDYAKFIKIEDVPKALYHLCKNGKEWTLENFTIDENLYKFVKGWGFWMFALRTALPEDQFEEIYTKVDETFLINYLKKESGKFLFKYTDIYLSNVLEVAGYPSTRHISASSFEWLFEKQQAYFNLLLDEFNRIQFDDENLSVLLRSAHIAYRYKTDTMPESIRKELTYLSQKAIGNFRSSIKDADYSTHEYLKGLSTVNEAVNFLCYFSSPAEGIKQLVQLLRNYGKVSINDDLTFLLPKQRDYPFLAPLQQQEHPDQEPPLNAEWFISKTEWIISTFFELGEADIDVARDDLAKFFGTRLKTKKGVKTETPKESDLIEPNSIWRTAYLSCIRALHCNPGGKLHQTINFSRNSDPDADVKSEAAKAYKEVRHNNPLPTNMERVLTIRRVFWYLRQAYYVSLLGINSLDTRGAQRTYSKEVERCKVRMKK
ncbi:hypothetical protein [Spirochaeta cellobiosiphila]|uniref:hypothetical protein n=1 Tax=Spirochaeta cellobiosiphila TaxID=504483 RepID=UPI00042A510C|nr:hypothetical protein [Spirochaeta cellobiosiphila]